VSAADANALYDASDHLPVILTLEIGPTSGVDEMSSPLLGLSVVPNPITDLSEIQFSLRKPENLNFRIFDAVGRLCWEAGEKPFYPGNNTVIPEWNKIPGSGVFFLSVSSYKTLNNSRLLILR
jgi:hypothetical protein